MRWLKESPLSYNAIWLVIVKCSNSIRCGKQSKPQPFLSLQLCHGILKHAVPSFDVIHLINKVLWPNVFLLLLIQSVKIQSIFVRMSFCLKKKKRRSFISKIILMELKLKRFSLDVFDFVDCLSDNLQINVFDSYCSHSFHPLTYFSSFSFHIMQCHHQKY